MSIESMSLKFWFLLAYEAIMFELNVSKKNEK